MVEDWVYTCACGSKGYPIAWNTPHYEVQLASNFICCQKLSSKKSVQNLKKVFYRINTFQYLIITHLVGMLHVWYFWKDSIQMTLKINVLARSSLRVIFWMNGHDGKMVQAQDGSCNACLQIRSWQSSEAFVRWCTGPNPCLWRNKNWFSM